MPKTIWTAQRGRPVRQDNGEARTDAHQTAVGAFAALAWPGLPR